MYKNKEKDHRVVVSTFLENRDKQIVLVYKFKLRRNMVIITSILKSSISIHNLTSRSEYTKYLINPYFSTPLCKNSSSWYHKCSFL